GLWRAGCLPRSGGAPNPAGLALRRVQGRRGIVSGLLPHPVWPQLHRLEVCQRLRAAAEPARRSRRGGHLRAALREPRTMYDLWGRRPDARLRLRQRRGEGKLPGLRAGLRRAGEHRHWNRDGYQPPLPAARRSRRRSVAGNPRGRKAGRAEALVHRSLAGAPGIELVADRYFGGRLTSDAGLLSTGGTRRPCAPRPLAPVWIYPSFGVT